MEEPKNKYIGTKVEVLDKGHATLVDYMGNDYAITQAARVSYGKGTKQVSKEEALIRYMLNHGHCVTSDTKILTRDLRWVDASSLKVGDKLMGFDELAGKYENKTRCCRKFSESHVVATGKKLEDVYEIEFEDGGKIKCTKDHKWISAVHNDESSREGANAKWHTSEVLKEKFLEGKKILLPKVFEVWEEDATYSSGFLAGAFDADGCLTKTKKNNHVSFCQQDNELLKEVVRETSTRGFELYQHLSTKSSKKQKAPVVRVLILGGIPESLRFLGTCRPKRLLANWMKKSLEDYKVVSKSWKRIVNIRLVEKQEIVLLETSSKTYIAEGFLAHNTSVFEQCVVKLHVKAPLFVLAQWLRHRTLSANQLSARYSEMEDSFYLPSEDRIQKQSLENRQGSGECLNATEALRIIEELKDEQEVAYSIYQKRLKKDEVSRELARINLPQSLYSELYITQNLHNLLHFLRLRMDSHAQYEIRTYANAVYELIQPLFPITCEAFEDYVIYAKRFSRHELNLLKDVLSSLANEEALSKKIKAQLTLSKDKYKLSKREVREFKEKLGLK
jgi:thymidylate synthase (FAD)